MSTQTDFEKKLTKSLKSITPSQMRQFLGLIEDRKPCKRTVDMTTLSTDKKMDYIMALVLKIQQDVEAINKKLNGDEVVDVCADQECDDDSSSDDE